MAFEKYTGARYTSRGAMVTVRKTGQIAFNASAAREMNIMDKPAVTLHYDKKNSLIGIKAENNQKTEGARKLGKMGRTRTVAASSFLNFYGIAIKKNLKIVPTYDKKSDMVILDLKKAMKVASRPRKKK